METDAAGLAILLWSCDRQNPERAATPFVVAQAAVALDKEVEMLFAAQSVQWLQRVHGDTFVGFGQQRLTMRQYLQATATLGVRIFACSQSMQAHALSDQDLDPQCAGQGGTVSFLERGMAPGWRFLVF